MLGIFKNNSEVYPNGQFLFVKSEYKDKFVKQINDSVNKKVFSVSSSSYKELEQFCKSINRCDFSGEVFSKDDSIVKCWVIDK